VAHYYLPEFPRSVRRRRLLKRTRGPAGGGMWLAVTMARGVPAVAQAVDTPRRGALCTGSATRLVTSHVHRYVSCYEANNPGKFGAGGGASSVDGSPTLRRGHHPGARGTSRRDTRRYRRWRTPPADAAGVRPPPARQRRPSPRRRRGARPRGRADDGLGEPAPELLGRIASVRPRPCERSLTTALLRAAALLGAPGLLSLSLTGALVRLLSLASLCGVSVSAVGSDSWSVGAPRPATGVRR
jgi:hypothetical protein